MEGGDEETEDEEDELSSSLLLRAAAARCRDRDPSKALSSAAFSASRRDRVAFSEAAFAWKAGQDREVAELAEEAGSSLALAESRARAAAGSSRPSVRKSDSENCKGTVVAAGTFFFSPDCSSSSLFS